MVTQWAPIAFTQDIDFEMAKRLSGSCTDSKEEIAGLERPVDP